MNIKKILVILPIITTLLGLILNFQNSIMGDTSINNLVVTLLYLVVWIITFSVCIKTRSLKVMKVYLIFWITTLFLAIVTVFINLTEMTANAVLPLIIVFLTQWVGIDYFVDDYLISFVCVSFISFTMSLISVIFVTKWNQG